MKRDQLREELHKHTKAALVNFIVSTTLYPFDHVLKVVKQCERQAELDALTRQERTLSERITVLLAPAEGADASEELDRMHECLRLSRKRQNVWSKQNRLITQLQESPL